MVGQQRLMAANRNRYSSSWRMAFVSAWGGSRATLECSSSCLLQHFVYGHGWTTLLGHSLITSLSLLFSLYLSLCLSHIYNTPLIRSDFNRTLFIIRRQMYQMFAQSFLTQNSVQIELKTRNIYIIPDKLNITTWALLTWLTIEVWWTSW